jgi:hypothetical protein
MDVEDDSHCFKIDEVFMVVELLIAIFQGNERYRLAFD